MKGIEGKIKTSFNHFHFLIEKKKKKQTTDNYLIKTRKAKL